MGLTDTARATELTLVGAISLTSVGAIALTNVSVIFLSSSVRSLMRVGASLLAPVGGNLTYVSTHRSSVLSEFRRYAVYGG
jgi:hypothetical protein